MDAFIALILSLSLVVSSTGFTSVASGGSEPHSTSAPASRAFIAEATRTVTIYSLDKDSFNQFIDNPTRSILEQNSEAVPAQVFTPLGGLFDRGQAKPFKVGWRLVSFAGNTEKLETLVGAKISDSAIIYTKPGLNMAIWVKTDRGNYFLEIVAKPILDRYRPSLIDDIPPDRYSYRYIIHDEAKFRELFWLPDVVPQEDVRLIIDGVDVTQDTYIKLNYQYDYVELSLPTIAQLLGATVEWQNNTDAIISYQGTDYILNTTRPYFSDACNPDNFLGRTDGKLYRSYFQALERDFIIDSHSVDGFLEGRFFVDINIDFVTGIVSIDTVETWWGVSNTNQFERNS